MYFLVWTNNMKKKVLIIGGTNFIGRNLVVSLLEDKQYDVTLFNRGISEPNLFPKIKKIRGDRYSKDIELLKNENWEYVVDTSCYHPKNLKEILKNINNGIKKYIFLSTCSVYDLDTEDLIIDEYSKIKSFSEEEDIASSSYGVRKVKCEQIIEESGIPYNILRPGLVYGPYDDSDRLYYWLYQIKAYKEVLVPKEMTKTVSITYVQDLVKVIKELIGRENVNELYNVISHPLISITEIVEVGKEQLKKEPILIIDDTQVLKEEKIKEWLDIPFWLKGNSFKVMNEKLKKEISIEITSFDDSIKETIQFYDGLNWVEPKIGLKRKEQERLMKRIKKVRQNIL